LKAGNVLAAGPKSEILNSRVLSKAFDTPVRLQKHRGPPLRYNLKQDHCN
jgi:ABC-type enterochelin transport system ATPase subunit